MNRISTARTALERLLLVWLILLSWAAYSWPAWLAHLVPAANAWDPFLASKPWLNYLFAVAMLAIGSLLPPEEIRQVLRRWPAVLGGTAIQYSVMPILAYCTGRLFGLEGPWLIGIILVGCVPGAMASNVLTLMAHGNASYSVSLTTSATIFSPLIVPWVLWLTLGQMVEDFDAVAVFINLCWMVVIPVITGHLLSRHYETWQLLAKQWAAIIANLTILWIIAVAVAANRDGIPHVDFRLISALLTVNLMGYAAGYGGGRLIGLPTGMRRALTLEVGMQNAGLGMALALKMFPDPAAALPSGIYTFGCMLTGTLLARIWAEFAEQPVTET